MKKGRLSIKKAESYQYIFKSMIELPPKPNFNEDNKNLNKNLDTAQKSFKSH